MGGLRWSLAVPATVGLLLLSGCINPGGCVPPAEPRSFRDENLPTAGAAGTQAATFHVTEIGGAAIEDAIVVVFWITDEDLSDAESRPADWRPPLGFMVLRTDGRGDARAFIPRSTYGGATAWAPGFTEEWTDWNHASGGTISLYRTNLEAWVNGTLPLLGTLQSWQPSPLVIGNATTSSEYMRRIVNLSLTMNWTVPQAAQADLGLGWSSGQSGNPEDSIDSRQELLAGNYTQGVTLDASRLFEYPAAHVGPRVAFVGPTNPWAYASVTDIPYMIHAEAEIGSREWMEPLCGVMFEDSEFTRADAGPVPTPEPEAPSPSTAPAQESGTQTHQQAPPAPAVRPSPPTLEVEDEPRHEEKARAPPSTPGPGLPAMLVGLAGLVFLRRCRHLGPR